jgi:hypothetical protein
MFVSRCFVTGVDGELGQPDPRAMLVQPRAIEQQANDTQKIFR